MEFVGFEEDDASLRIHKPETRYDDSVTWFAMAPVLDRDHVAGVMAGMEGAFRSHKLASSPLFRDELPFPVSNLSSFKPLYKKYTTLNSIEHLAKFCVRVLFHQPIPLSSLPLHPFKQFNLIMLCMRCIRRLVLAREPSRPSVPRRNFTSTRSILSESHLDPLARTPSTTPAFSTPFTNPPSESTPPDVETPEPKRTKSKAKAGMVLKGLGYLKGSENPLAAEDSEYPDWLWGLLDTKERKMGKGEEEGDIFC